MNDTITLRAFVDVLHHLPPHVHSNVALAAMRTSMFRPLQTFGAFEQMSCGPQPFTRQQSSSPRHSALNIGSVVSHTTQPAVISTRHAFGAIGCPAAPAAALPLVV